MSEKNSNALQSLSKIGDGKILDALKDLHKISSKSLSLKQGNKISAVEKQDLKNNQSEANRITSTKISGSCPVCGAQIILESCIKTVD